MVDSGSQSTKGLIIVSKLYQEGKIDDDQRDQLKGKYILSLTPLFNKTYINVL